MANTTLTLYAGVGICKELVINGSAEAFKFCLEYSAVVLGFCHCLEVYCCLEYSAVITMVTGSNLRSSAN